MALPVKLTKTKGRAGFILPVALGLCIAFSGPIARADAAPVAGKPWVNSLGVKFVPAGTDGVLFSVWDVRVKDFQAFVTDSSYDVKTNIMSMKSDGWQHRGDSWSSPGFSQTDDDPVVGVSGKEGKAFCSWLTKKEQQAGKLTASQKYRLPTDTEWIKAAGPGTYPWGDDWPPPAGAGNYAGEDANDANWQNDRPTLADYTDGYPRTSPVGSFKPNSYGLYDMGGDVIQWCQNTYSFILCGTSWCSAAKNELASACTFPYPKEFRRDDIGFRVVLDIASPIHVTPASTTKSTSQAFGTPSSEPGTDATPGNPDTDNGFGTTKPQPDDAPAPPDNSDSGNGYGTNAAPPDPASP